MKGIKKWVKATAALASLSMVAAACGSGSSSSSSSSSSATTAASTGPLTVGELLPMSGAEAFVGQWFDHGIKAGVYEINHHGGVLGHQLTTALQDTAGDPVDAVTAWKSLQLQHPNFVTGPSSLSIMGVINQFQQQKVVDLMEGGTTQLDHMTQSYIYRVFPSDSVLLAAEAYYALKGLNCTKASLIYTSDANAQAEVPPLTAAFTGNGGKILDNEQIQAGQSSYLSEVSRAFANNPQCVFFHADPQTAATLFANVKQLGHLNVHFITGDTGTSIQLAQAVGLADASKWMTGMAAPAAYAPAYNEFLAAYKGQWNSSKPLPASPAMYDAVVMAALAMTAAHSTNPHVWVKYITKISNPPGTPVYTYAQGVALLKQGKKINYQGASGPENFNQYHNVFSGFDVQQFNTAGVLHTVQSITSSQVAAMYNSKG
ncbi:ABC transporter substrate-binding protein [Acidithrix sp. C25]|uniref:ABC transporter substrate-binding protein n=1 Tax=Acidithrix sp. C25 TaxID=1671482 RepID=UPI00191B9649|nr:ABC transporter substrate-binding protein [Acidithrix sp. C25]